MEIAFIPHARARMELRGISVNMVLDCIHGAVKKDEGYLGRKVFYRKFGKKYVKVVYEVGRTELRVITVMWVYKLP